MSPGSKGARSIRLASVSFVVAMSITACAPDGQSAAPSQSPATHETSPAPKGPSGTVSMRVPTDWSTLDPQLTQNTTSLQILLATNDRLVAMGPGGTIVPYVAKSWKVTATEATFTLRSDVTCADGTRLTPTAVANSFKRWFAPETKSPVLARFFGSGPYSVSADESAGTITLKLGTPFNDVLVGLAAGYGSIICPAGLSDPSSLTERTHGSGPFTIDSAKHGDSITLKARRDWKWGPNRASTEAAGFPELLVYKVVANETTAANLLLTGGLDLGTVQGRDVPRLSSERSLAKSDVQSYNTEVMRFNEDPGRPTVDEKVREALMTVVDPSAYSKASSDGAFPASSSTFAPTMPCFDPGTANLMPKPDTGKARQVLLSAGYAPGNDGILVRDGKPLTIRVLSNSTTTAPEYVAEQFRNIGVNVVLRVVEQVVYASDLFAGNWDVVLIQYSTPFPSPSYSAFNLDSANPAARIHDDVITSEIKAAQAALPGLEQCQHWVNVQRRYLSQHHVMPLTLISFFWFARGVQFQPGVLYTEPSAIRRP